MIFPLMVNIFMAGGGQSYRNQNGNQLSYGSLSGGFIAASKMGIKMKGR